MAVVSCDLYLCASSSFSFPLAFRLGGHVRLVRSGGRMRKALRLIPSGASASSSLAISLKSPPCGAFVCVVPVTGPVWALPANTRAFPPPR